MSKNRRSDPIGHLPVNEQVARDAAAGPREPVSPGSAQWPGPVKPSTKYRGGGGFHPGGIRFQCADCDYVADSITHLIHHTLWIHRRRPVDRERVPLGNPKVRK